MTDKWIAGAAGALISFLLQSIPKLRDWWNKLSDTQKRVGWIVGCLVVPLAVLGLGCLGLYLGVNAPPCTQQGLLDAVGLGIAAFFGGQASYALIGRPLRDSGFLKAGG